MKQPRTLTTQPADRRFFVRLAQTHPFESERHDVHAPVSHHWLITNLDAAKMLVAS